MKLDKERIKELWKKGNKIPAKLTKTRTEDGHK
jgi:hypothetical protein